MFKSLIKTGLLCIISSPFTRLRTYTCRMCNTSREGNEEGRKKGLESGATSNTERRTPNIECFTLPSFVHLRALSGLREKRYPAVSEAIRCALAITENVIVVAGTDGRTLASTTWTRDQPRGR